MTDLVKVCSDLGYRDPKTLVASGNVVLETDDVAADVEAALKAALFRMGLVADVLVRGSAELKQVIDANPFPDAVADHPSRVTVTIHRAPFSVARNSLPACRLTMRAVPATAPADDLSLGRRSVVGCQPRCLARQPGPPAAQTP